MHRPAAEESYSISVHSFPAARPAPRCGQVTARRSFCVLDSIVVSALRACSQNECIAAGRGGLEHPVLYVIDHSVLTYFGQVPADQREVMLVVKLANPA